MIFRKLHLVSSLFLGLCLTQVTLADNKNIEVTPMQQVTAEELAVIYVLSEVCPSIVSNQAQFSSGYEKLVKEYLPEEKQPVEALKKLTQTPKFKPILDEARVDAKNAGTDKNKVICEELVTYTN
ncbi:hypothetical protein B9T31_08005 [Acinetobacter sp. ANC 4558]|uniref:MCR_0457 family protein n=1 Tax=Acinetobacter sp. ANC 4558 TaxID=1977876 RepID=UPI000A33912D|nr:hypothetical protein [Acinetobacter sp. ANC 4558]OTG86427.1 hypothetical protein B9T31_08005 [Acinetobacter sp. ANC 4558]